MLDLGKRIGSHAFYEFFRSCFAGAAGSLQERLEDLELISDGALVDDSFLDEFLIQCQDVDRLERLAKLFHKNLCEYDAAIQIYQKLIELHSARHGPNHQFVAGTYSTIADIMQIQGKSDEALEIYDVSIRLCAKSLRVVHPAIASMLNNMAGVLCKQDRLDEGYATYGNAVKIYKHKLEERNPEFDSGHILKALAGTYHNMAGVLIDQSNFDEALKLHREALELKLQEFGETHESVATSFNSTGEVLESQDKPDEAMANYERLCIYSSERLGIHNLLRQIAYKT